jgi:hypothetical protein
MPVSTRKSFTLVIAVLGVLAGMLALASAPVLAAAPEAPQLSPPAGVPATHVEVTGVLNPGKEGGPGTYELDTYRFLYRASKSECEGGSATSESLALGGGEERVSEELSGLTPGTEYTICLQARYGPEATLSPPVTFKTMILPEAPGTLAATAITGATATLHGVLNPTNAIPAGETESYEFRYLPSASECEREETIEGTAHHIYDTAASGGALGARGETVEGPVAGLLPGTVYTFCLVALNGAGEGTTGAPQTFTTATTAPTVGEETAVSVGSSEATVGAQIDPGALPTTYHVEYGTSTAYGASTPETRIGASSSAASALARLSGLQPGAEYHFRFVATNERGSTHGEDNVITTTASTAGSSSLLPDNRAYELVSSPTDNITVDTVSGSRHATSSLPWDGVTFEPDQASADGDAIAYPADPAHEGGNGEFGAGASNEWVATRSATGWTANDVTPPGATVANYAFFSNDLSVGVFLANASPNIAASPAAPPGCQRAVYSRSADGSYHSLIAQVVKPAECGAPRIPGVSADDTHLIFASEAALTAGSQAAQGFSGDNLYDSAGGALYQVNILPDGSPEPAPNAWLGAQPLADVAYFSSNFRGAISTDGSRIVWTSAEQPAGSGTPALYLRENDTQPQSPIGPGGKCSVAGDACTLQIDMAEAKCVAEGGCKTGGGVFWAASADDSKVFFTDENRLTADSTAEAAAPDLYEYQVAGGRLTDLTVAKVGHANVQGVIGTSETGEYLYFAAGGVLASNEAADGETAQKGSEEGAPNIYVLHGGVASFIAAGNVSLLNVESENFGDLDRGPNNRTAGVTPNGEGMVFVSKRRLTGYDNRGAAFGSPADETEAFVYDALTGRIACVSCDPSGVPPSQPVDVNASPLPVRGGELQTSDPVMPGWVAGNGARVFFDSVQPLVSQDTNGLVDVYEWERPALGSEQNNTCTTASPNYSVVNQGCVSLLSGGQSADASYFADADANGDNVFFSSRGQLLPQVGNENMALYDARVDGGFPELSTACVGTGCQGLPPAPPIFATPSSVTFNGVGNFESQPTVVRKRVTKRAKCKKGTVRRGGKCIKAKVTKRSKRPGKRATGRKK